MGRPARTVEFFRVWTPAMAYVLGYWWADGYMYIKASSGAHVIEIASNDQEHLEAIALAIGEKYFTRQVTALSSCYELAFCSKEMYHDLLALGGSPRKSRTIGMPDVPTELLPHFVRGVIDGDGTLSWNAGKPILQIYSGSSSFLADLSVVVAAATGIPAPRVVANRANWYIKWSTIRAKCLAAWLYVEHPGMALGRKAAVAAAFLQWQPGKRPQKGSITDEMRQKFSTYLPS